MDRRLGLGWLGAALLATGVAACGDDSETTGSGGGGTGGAGATTTSTTAATSTGGEGGGTGGNGTGGGTGGDPQTCTTDDPTTVTVVVTNDTAERLWFQGSAYGRRRIAGLAVDGQGDSSCPCDDLASCSGAVATISTNVGYLDPGESFEEPWLGLFYVDDPVCEAELSCQAGRRAEDGQHTARATAYRGAPFCDAACECDLAQGEICNYGDGADTASDPVEAEIVFVFPDEATIEITFTADGG